MNFFKSLILLCLLAFSQSASAQTHTPVETSSSPYLEMLNAIDTVPSKEALTKSFPDIVEKLEASSCDVGTKLYARHRALSLLSLFDLSGRTALVRLIKCPIPEIKERAIYTLARTFPADKEVIALVLNFKHLESESTALWSIRALRWLSPETAKNKLEELSKSASTKHAKLAHRILEIVKNGNKHQSGKR